MTIQRKAVLRFLLLVPFWLGMSHSSLAAQGGVQVSTDSPTVVEIRVQGNQRYTRNQLIAALGQSEGLPLDRRRVSTGLEVLWRSFHVVPRVSYREVEGGVVLLLEVEEVPSDFEPRFIGNAEVDTDELYEWAGLAEGEEIYLNRIPRIRQRLLEAYIEEGYYFVEISDHVKSGGEDLPGGASDVFFEIREGPRVKVMDVHFAGNKSLPNSRFLFWRNGLGALSEVETGTRNFPFYLRPYLVQETLDADLIAMRNVYRDLGWLDAVVELDHLEFNEARDRVEVFIAIDEGEPYTVASLNIEGVERVRDPADPNRIRSTPTNLIDFDGVEGETLDALLEVCDLKIGSVFEKRVLERDKYRLRLFYGEHGYISHNTLPVLERFEFLEPRYVYDVEKHEIHVTYLLAQGQQHFIQEVRFVGTDKTQERVFRREVSVFPGEIADLKEIDASLRRIRSLPAFRSRFGGVSALPTEYRFVQTGDSAWKDLEFSLSEPGTLNFDISAAASSGTGISAGVSLQLHNFDATRLPSSGNPWTVLSEIATGDAFYGAGQTLNLRLFPGTEISTYSIEFREPDLFGKHLDRYSMNLSGYRRLSRFDTHDEERREVGIRIGKQLTPDSGVFAGYSNGSVILDDLQPAGAPSFFNPIAVPELLAAQEGKLDLAKFEVGYNWRSLDYPIAPNSGHTINFSTSIYDEAFGSEAEFVQSRFVFDYYLPIGEDIGVPRSRLRTRFDLGVSKSYGATNNVPYSERFFLGGRSLRGFDRRGVGPNQNGDPIGGESQAAGRLEYIFPLFTSVEPGSYRRQEKFTGAVFFDAGILDTESFSLDTNELRTAVGFSVSLWLGLPLTLSFGFPLREGFDDETRTFRFDIGIR
ncbi:MAG: outer membrane protein insertion porin family [Planctomycetota bacterium]